MPQPLSICLEQLDVESSEDRYLQCVATVGRGPGLRVSAAGEIRWCDDAAVAAELWVSADDRLMLFRPEAAPGVRVDRAGRGLDVPCGKPVVLRHGDTLAAGQRRYQVHVHGPTPLVTAPKPFRPRAAKRGRAVAVAALGVALAGCPDIEVRDRPPTAPVPPPPPLKPAADVLPLARAAAAGPRLESLARQAVPDMQPEGPPLVGRFDNQEILTQTHRFEPGKTYAVVGIGLAGVKSFYVQLVTGAPPNLSPWELAASLSQGEELVLGERGTPVQVHEPMQVSIHAQMYEGAGVVMLQLYSKRERDADAGAAVPPDAGSLPPGDAGSAVPTPDDGGTPQQ